jgi:hypothetical protein
VEPMAGIGQPAALHIALRTNALALEFALNIKRFLHTNRA